MFTLWFTGLSTSKKSVMVEKVTKFLKGKGLTVISLNANNCMGVKWAVYVAELLNKQGAVVVASFFSYSGLRELVRKTITKCLDVWVQGTDKTHVFEATQYDIRVDIDINSAESCAKLVESYLYLHKIIELSEKDKKK